MLQIFFKQIKIKKNIYILFISLVLVGQAECWLQPTGADQRGYNPDDIMFNINLDNSNISFFYIWFILSIGC